MKKNLNIWLLMTGEPLEMFGNRPHRIGILSKILAKRGHNVTWFTTTFDHQSKKYLYSKTIFIRSKLGVRMVFLHSRTPYFKNISLRRIKNHIEIAKEFINISKKMQKPDIILTSFPTICLASKAVKYAKQNDIPIIVDVRDMWPEIFLDILPKFIRFFGKIPLIPLYNKTKHIFKNATAITAMTDEFVLYGLKFAKRKRKNIDKAFPFGYDLKNLSEKEKKESLEKLILSGFNPSLFTVCFFGTVGRQFNFHPIIEVAKQLHTVQFVIAGNGDLLEELKKKTKNIENIILTGWIGKNDILTLMEYSHLAIAPYLNKDDFLSSLPNKIIEYMAGGLPVLSSIDGVIGKLIKEYKIGYVYYDNISLLKDTILRLKKDKQLREKMSLNAKSLFNRKFRADIVYNNMADYIEEIAESYKRVEL